MGFEPTTPRLLFWCSTTSRELLIYTLNRQLQINYYSVSVKKRKDSNNSKTLY